VEVLLSILAATSLFGFAGQAKPAAGNPQRVVFRPAATNITSLSTLPTTVNFALTNPDGAPVTGAGSVTWHTTGGSTSSTWTLGVSTAAGSFTGCTEIPPGAVTASCSSVSVGTGTCNGAAPALGLTATTIASGNEGSGNTTYTVNVQFAITDAWKYKGHTSACTLNVTYTITAP
jgi:hypothetical protein